MAVLVAAPSLLAAQQSQVVRGRVLAAATGQPLAGVQVSVKGLAIGALTDDQGVYTFRVPSETATLVFTSLGYVTQERAFANDLEIRLEQQAIGLEGIVVTALGVQREKRSLGYSVQAVSGADITKVPEVNIVNALQGEVAGVHITNAGPTGGTSRIVIRGASSIAGSNQPLFIVDGIPVDNSAPGDGYGRNQGYGGIDYGNAIQDLDSNNIESISVLKGPNAAALYGSRAANGAVVITTKSGRTSRGFSFSTSFTGETPLRLPDYQNLYGQGVDGEFQWVDGAGAGTWDFVDESWGPRLDGRLIDQFTGKQQPWVAHPDNVRSFFRTGLTSNTNLSFEQSGTRGNVRISLTNLKQEGMAPGESIGRIGVALKGSTSVTDRLTTEASLNYTSSEAKNRMGTGYDEDNPMQSFIWFGRQVDMAALKANYRCWEGSPTPCTEGGQYNWNYNYHNNPYWEQLVNTNGDERDRLLGHVQATYQINDWITATGRIGRDWYRDHRKDVTAFNSLDDAGDGGFGETNIFRSEINADLIVTATRQLTPDITLDVTGGGNIRTSDYETSSVTVSALTAPGIYTIDNASVTPNPTDYMWKKKVRSLYGSASLNYKGWFNIDATGRNDWSSTLPENNRSYFYPSVSSALVFSDALGMRSDFFSSGKLRASWTRVGNDTDPYQLSSVYGAQQAWGAVPMFAVPNELPNAELKPEETTAFEVGTDLGFLNERLGFVLTYYQANTKNQILGVQISSTSGYTSQVLNAGEVKNWGYELLLRATPLQTEDFQWDMTVNWSKNNSEVTDLYGDLETLVLGTYWSLNIEARKGEPYGVMFGNGYLKDDQGRWLLDSRGRPQRDPVRRVLGNYNPDWNGGIQNRFSYGPLELSVLVDGQRGGDIFSVTNWFGEYAGVLESSLWGRENDFCDPGIAVPGIMPDGSVNGDGVNDVTVCPETYFGRNYGNQESGIDDATYIKLREMRLGYQLPQSLMDRFGFSGGDIALIGRNLALWAPNMPNIDPETAFDASNVQGIEFGQFPSARSIGLSLSIRP
ncbi:MAG: SusC/RagA family TonB-linked outer membrane protein [Gemmatimonadota bacterium]